MGHRNRFVIFSTFMWFIVLYDCKQLSYGHFNLTIFNCDWSNRPFSLTLRGQKLKIAFNGLVYVCVIFYNRIPILVNIYCKFIAGDCLGRFSNNKIPYCVKFNPDEVCSYSTIVLFVTRRNVNYQIWHGFSY